MAIIEHDRIVQAISPEGPDHPFAEPVRLRCSRRCDQTSGAEALDPVTRLEMRTRCASLEDDDLLAEQRVLGDELGTPAEDVADHAEAGLDELAKHGVATGLTGSPFQRNQRSPGTTPAA